VKAGDVDWERKSLLVRSPKTAGNPNHADRVVPVCQELQPIILDLYEAAPEGAVEMVPQAHRAHVNIFLGLKKIVERAGLKPWPRLLQNLRSSCATDWAYDCPGVESSKWMGHSKVVAAEHYLQSRDLNFKAVTGSLSLPDFRGQVDYVLRRRICQASSNWTGLVLPMVECLRRGL
jgi:hypothetical protein